MKKKKKQKAMKSMAVAAFVLQVAEFAFEVWKQRKKHAKKLRYKAVA
ncbi:MAG TPA: hypothetical protein VHK69_05325 [Chitinophagaceae bacterium]|jgi:hypothetical protein|nr:hypothetical protein [Chitinophagaceae bacterium]